MTRAEPGNPRPYGGRFSHRPPQAGHKGRGYLALALICLLGNQARAGDLSPAWAALPDETALVVRLPSGAAFVDALRQQTKLGTVLLSSERLDRLTDAFMSASPEDWDEFRQTLGRYDLKPEDWRALVRGEVGFAVALQPRADREPLVVGLGWLDAGDDVSGRLLAALQAVVAEQADEPHGLVRDDLQLAGIEVTHLAGPILTSETPKIDFEPGPSGVLSDEEIQERITEHQKRLQDTPREETDRMHFFMARLGGRLLFGMTFPQSSEKVRAMRGAGEEAIDWDEVTGLDAATATFGRFLSGQTGSETGRVASLLATPGVGEHLPGGTALMEIVGDPRPLVKLADLDSTGRAQRAIEVLGLASLGPLALRISLDDSVLRSAMVLSAPAPRSGVVALLDQDTLTPDPPAWVPASASEYQQISFDLSKAYASLKQMAGQQAGQQGSQTFDQIETAARLFAGADLTALLASLGRQISIVTFPTKAGGQPAGDQPGQAASAARVGIVVPVNDEQIWKRLLDHFAGSGAGGLRAVEEQGFSGYRISAGSQDVGVFLAASHLVIGVGPGVSESLLSVLRTPPEAGAAMRTSGLVERARSLLPAEKCLAYSLAGGSSGADLRQELLSLIDQLASPIRLAGSAAANTAESDGADSDAVAFLNKLKELLPTADELEGAVGVSVDQTIVNEQGLLMQSALELPSP